MKKVYKLMCCCAVFFLIFIIVVVLYGMYINWYKGNRPIDQPNKKWVSEDGSIKLSTDENQRTTGSMIINGKEIEILFLDGEGKNIHIFPIETKVRDINDRYELWVGDFISEDKFTVTVEKTTYFEVGQKITFYRVEDE